MKMQRPPAHNAPCQRGLWMTLRKLSVKPLHPLKRLAPLAASVSPAGSERHWGAVPGHGVPRQHPAALAATGKAFASRRGARLPPNRLPLVRRGRPAALTLRRGAGTRAAVCAHGAGWPAAPTRIPAAGRAFRAGMQRGMCFLLWGICCRFVLFLFFNFSIFFLLLAAFGCLFFEQLIWVVTFAKRIGEPGAH